MDDQTSLPVWVLLIGVVVLGTGVTVGNIPAASPAIGDSTSERTGVSGVPQPSAVTGQPASGIPGTDGTKPEVRSFDTPSRADRQRGKKTDETAANEDRTVPSYNCSSGAEQVDASSPGIDQEALSQTTVGLEMINSTVTRRVPDNGSETFTVRTGTLEAERLCTIVDTGDPESIRMQFKNATIMDGEIVGNGVRIRFERAEADYIDQEILL